MAIYANANYYKHPKSLNGEGNRQFDCRRMNTSASVITSRVLSLHDNTRV